MDYQEQFSKRCESYFLAMSKYPQALSEEFRVATEFLALKGDETVVNIPAGCVNLEQFLDKTIHYKPFEINEHFAKRVGQEICCLFNIPCESQSVDRVISVAGLHHTSQEERKLFYQEVKRILKSSGFFVIADVQQGSNQDRWLNEFVHTYNSLGHQGHFWSNEDIALLNEAGFTVELYEKNYTWNFANRAEMLDFSKDLFYLDKASPPIINQGLDTILYADSTRIPWKLLYFKCQLGP